jgi:bifunctional DNA-binding transcriptional regulator/antitoxin component of YhaV-PrlF toxin-antitoxin module
LRRALGLREGDLVSAELRDGTIVVKPASVIDTEDAWFHTKEWQAKEAEADADIAAGRVEGPFHTVEDFKASLSGKNQKKKPGRRT